MSQVIADTYEIKKEIGSGGGGVVYLAWHKRLGKDVVLKEDRRSIATAPEVLRREVDILKNLSHTYIPQVYDFFSENGKAYTVMDYIEGEDFAHLLKRGERFSQAQVVEWAIQILEALCYLHSRAPHGILHGDIKPGNVMLTPENDIRLIDFNIALALGEEGAVRVGYSQGYASPEHYGIDYSRSNIPTEIMDQEKSESEKTVPLDATGNMSEAASKTPISRGSSQTSGGGKILLDVRSDIYSLGATLYHILTGRRPKTNADQVLPITEEEASPAVIRIIHKAMERDPDLRFQSAQEMLDAFFDLPKNDARTRRLRRTKVVTAVTLIVVFLAGGGSTFTGLKQMENLQNAYVLAEQSENEFQKGNVGGAIELALQALPEKRNLFSAPYTAEAQKALADALGIYDLADGFRDFGMIQLPAEPVKVKLSADGNYLAAIASQRLSVVDTTTMQIVKEFKTDASALSDVVFVNEHTILYAGKDALRAFDLQSGQELWSGEAATGITVSADGTTVAAVYKEAGEAIVYNAVNGSVLHRVSFEGHTQPVLANDVFADPEDSIFALNADGSMLAASFSDGALMIFEPGNADGTLEIYDKSEYTHFEGGFFGKYFAFSSTNSEESVFAVVDTAETVQTGGFTLESAIGVEADESGIYLKNEDVVVAIDPETGDQQEVAYVSGLVHAYSRGTEHILASGADNTYHFFDRQAREIASYESDFSCDFVQIANGVAVIGSLSSPSLRVMKLVDHSDAQFFSYDPSYDHDEARISADAKTVLLFRYDSFRLLNKEDGSILCEMEIPDAEQVYDQQYRRTKDGSYLEVIYNDGTIRKYSAFDGTMLSEEKGDAPEESLYEEFLTDDLKITSPLHGTPEVYERKSGKKICNLETDDYLTYVTQVGEYVITEYITSDGDRYGLLMNGKCETLARLPNLCDILDGELIFDDRSGNLRKTKIYSREELRKLGQERMESPE